ncbi:transposase domain-containing protein [Actinacidiphila oryziradicis]|uniref:transposase domain-containing protein n=1 Tax=Actinacidiphila oryziradicis TaxID=2571141 RepID=UPI003211EFD4|nr:family transposase [Actinacidiphila oryziradicis]
MREESVITRTIEAAGGAYAPGHLGELTQIVDFSLVDAVLEETGTRERRLRLLPFSGSRANTSSTGTSSSPSSGTWCGWPSRQRAAGYAALRE